MTDERRMAVEDDLVRSRLAVIRDEIAATGRTDVRVIAVTKGFDRSAVDSAQHVGLTDIGENYAQEVEEKSSAVDPSTTVHFIGRIQRNKVRKIAGMVDLWQSVARPEILVELAKRSPSPRALIQMRPIDDPTKDGVHASEVEEMLEVAAAHDVAIDGLMTIGVLGDREATIESFEALTKVADQFELRERSMGMSGDYRDALNAGATMLRLGSVLFGPRPTR